MKTLEATLGTLNTHVAVHIDARIGLSCHEIVKFSEIDWV